MARLIHGTPQGYRRGCKCDSCRAAWRDHHRALRSRRLADDDPRHGTYSGFDHFGCRCTRCVAAKAARRLAVDESGKWRARYRRRRTERAS